MSVNSYVNDSKISLSFPIYDKLQAKAALEEDLNNVASWYCTNRGVNVREGRVVRLQTYASVGPQMSEVGLKI